MYVSRIGVWRWVLDKLVFRDNSKETHRDNSSLYRQCIYRLYNRTIMYTSQRTK